jgi:hypothetical protein
VGGVLLVAAHLCLVTAPTMSTELHLARLNTLRLDPDDPRACLAVLDYAGAALRADPLDADAAREMARLAGSLSSNANLPTATRLELLRGAERFGELALRRDPRSSAAHTRLAGVYERMEALDLLDDADAARQALHKAAEHWQAAVALSPMDPRRQIAAGRAWFEWWEETDDPQAARYAAEHLAAAIRIDRTRQPGEVVALRPAEWAEISSRLRALEAAGFGVPTASAPATAPATAPVSGPTTGPATAPGP